MKSLNVAGLWLALVIVAALNWIPGWAARNGSGSYTVPNSFSPGQTITSSGMNQNFSDIGSELTNSVAADGQTSMTGPLKAASGTCAAPSLTFAADTDTGLYRSAANEVTLCVGGVALLTFNSTTVTLASANLNLSAGSLQQAGAALVPVGVVAPYAGTTAPTGWLLMRGQCVSRTDYANLFALLSTTFNSGCTAAQFGIPDLGGRVVAGSEASASRLTVGGSGCAGNTLGATCGLQTSALSNINQVPVHSHGPGTLATGAGSAHSHDVQGYPTASGGSNTGIIATSVATGSPVTVSGGNNPGSVQNESNHTHSVSTGLSGNAGAASPSSFSTQPPTIVLGYIIKH